LKRLLGILDSDMLRFLKDLTRNFFSLFRMLNPWSYGNEELKVEFENYISPQEFSDLERGEMKIQGQEISDMKIAEKGKKKAIALPSIEALIGELQTYISGQETSDLEIAEKRKKLAIALQSIQALIGEFRAYISGQETSDLEKAEVMKKLEIALQSIEASKRDLKQITESAIVKTELPSAFTNLKAQISELRTHISQQKLSDIQKAEIWKEIKIVLQNFEPQTRSYVSRQELSDKQKEVMWTIIATALQSVETQISEMRNCISGQKFSEMEKEVMWKRIAGALQSTETQIDELRAYTSREKISDNEKAGIRKEVISVLQSIEDLERGLREMTSDTGKKILRQEQATDSVGVHN
jgi:hypothetical protein